MATYPEPRAKWTGIPEPEFWPCPVCDDDCDTFGDIRQLACGCYAHKECVKMGGRCKEHGARG